MKRPVRPPHGPLHVRLMVVTLRSSTGVRPGVRIDASLHLSRGVGSAPGSATPLSPGPSFERPSPAFLPAMPSSMLAVTATCRAPPAPRPVVQRCEGPTLRTASPEWECTSASTTSDVPRPGPGPGPDPPPACSSSSESCRSFLGRAAAATPPRAGLLLHSEGTARAASRWTEGRDPAFKHRARRALRARPSVRACGG
jgi:hypothetical protein